MAIGDRNPKLCPTPGFPIEGPYGRCYSEDLMTVEPPRAVTTTFTPLAHFPSADDPEFRAGYMWTGLWVVGTNDNGDAIYGAPGDPALGTMNVKPLHFFLPMGALGFTDRAVITDPATGQARVYQTFFEAGIINTFGRS